MKRLLISSISAITMIGFNSSLVAQAQTPEADIQTINTELSNHQDSSQRKIQEATTPQGCLFIARFYVCW